MNLQLSSILILRFSLKAKKGGVKLRDKWRYWKSTQDLHFKYLTLILISYSYLPSIFIFVQTRYFLSHSGFQSFIFFFFFIAATRSWKLVLFRWETISTDLLSKSLKWIKSLIARTEAVVAGVYSGESWHRGYYGEHWTPTTLTCL